MLCGKTIHVLRSVSAKAKLLRDMDSSSHSVSPGTSSPKHILQPSRVLSFFILFRPSTSFGFVVTGQQFGASPRPRRSHRSHPTRLQRQLHFRNARARAHSAAAYAARRRLFGESHRFSQGLRCQRLNVLFKRKRIGTVPGLLTQRHVGLLKFHLTELFDETTYT